jgi:hypothetical protein
LSELPDTREQARSSWFGQRRHVARRRPQIRQPRRRQDMGQPKLPTLERAEAFDLVGWLGPIGSTTMAGLVGGHISPRARVGLSDRTVTGSYFRLMCTTRSALPLAPGATRGDGPTYGLTVRSPPIQLPAATPPSLARSALMTGDAFHYMASLRGAWGYRGGTGGPV